MALGREARASGPVDKSTGAVGVRARLHMRSVRLKGIDGTSLKRGHGHVCVAHDLDVKRLFFATPGERT